jgi:hypothetical protein
MDRKCTVCTHPKRGEIDRELFQQNAGRAIAKKYGVDYQAVYYHRNNHLMPVLAAHEAAEELAQAESLWNELRRLKRHGWRFLERAERKNDSPSIAAAMREVRSCIELCAKLEGQIQENTVINVINLPQWQVLQQVLITTLEAFPEARLAVADRLAHYMDTSSAFVHVEMPRNGRDKS